MDGFNIEIAFKKYLAECYLDIDLLPADKLQEIKSAFMAGNSFMFGAIASTVEYDLDFADVMIENMRTQLVDFAKNLTNNKIG